MFAVYGLVDVDQQTPRAVTEAPPSDTTLPPEDAVVDVIAVIAAVVTDATTGFTVRVMPTVAGDPDAPGAVTVTVSV